MFLLLSVCELMWDEERDAGGGVLIYGLEHRESNNSSSGVTKETADNGEWDSASQNTIDEKNKEWLCRMDIVKVRN